MLRRSALAFSMLALSACPGDDGAANGTETDTGTDTDGTAESGTTMTPVTMSSSASMSSTTDETTDTSATTLPGTSDSGESGTATTSGSSESGSASTGMEDATYPPCAPDMDPPCPEGYDACYDMIPAYNVCNVVGCETPEDCPLANGGEAQVLCIPFEGGTCVLDCAGGLTCPDGMECVDLGETGIERCLWPVR